MNISRVSYFLILGFTIFGILTNSVKFNPIRFHCNNYVLNTYLYMILGWAVVFGCLESIYMNNVEPSNMYSGMNGYILVFILFIGLSLLTIIPSTWFLTKHITYLLTLLIIF